MCWAFLLAVAHTGRRSGCHPAANMRLEEKFDEHVVEKNKVKGQFLELEIQSVTVSIQLNGVHGKVYGLINVRRSHTHTAQVRPADGNPPLSRTIWAGGAFVSSTPKKEAPSLFWWLILLWESNSANRPEGCRHNTHPHSHKRRNKWQDPPYWPPAA